MSKSLVEESVDELIYMAESDIIGATRLLTGTYYPEDRMYNIICFHAIQAVEKLLKGFIISNGKTVEKIHNLDSLHQTATAIDASFAEIEDDCLILNTYLPDIRYSSNRNQLTKKDIDKTIKSLNKFAHFPPIKTMRLSFGKKHKYKIAAKVTVNPAKPVAIKNDKKKK